MTDFHREIHVGVRKMTVGIDEPVCREFGVACSMAGTRVGRTGLPNSGERSVRRAESAPTIPSRGLRPRVLPSGDACTGTTTGYG